MCATLSATPSFPPLVLFFTSLLTICFFYFPASSLRLAFNLIDFEPLADVSLDMYIRFLF